MDTVPVAIPSAWAPTFQREPPPDPLWEAAGTLARAGQNEMARELAQLMAVVRRAPTDYWGPDGTPLLVRLLENWKPYNAMPFIGSASPVVPRYPLPGEPPWDEQGAAEPWELPAALLIARGANPFEEAPDGCSGWTMAHEKGGAGLVAQMLRHPTCPPPVQWPWPRQNLIFALGPALPPLHLAVLAHPTLVPLLLAAGAPMEQIDAKGETPLLKSPHADTFLNPSGAIRMALDLLGRVNVK